MAVAMDYRVSSLEKAVAEMAREVKDEVRTHRDGSEHERRESHIQPDDETIKMRRQWGERARKIGRMVDYLVEPVLPDIFRRFVNCPEGGFDSAVHMWRHNTIDPTLVHDFDMVVSNDDYALINETKSDLTPDNISEFVALLGRVREFIPEFADKKVIGAIGSLYVDQSLVAHGQRYGLIVLGFGDDVMQVLNSEGFTPKTF
jgi:hypothetical protein